MCVCVFNFSLGSFSSISFSAISLSCPIELYNSLKTVYREHDMALGKARWQRQLRCGKLLFNILYVHREIHTHTHIYTEKPMCTCISKRKASSGGIAAVAVCGGGWAELCERINPRFQGK